MLDLSRRSSKIPDGTAESFLRTLDQRHPEMRPHRGATWYRQLARYSVGKIGYAEILAAADTTAKRAEIYFYEAMRRLADGKPDDAHQLWQKVVDTKMFSFFEFDMAARYLRVGAPSAPGRAPRRRHRDHLSPPRPLWYHPEAFSRVPWPSGKARVCKTLIPRFKSGRHLNLRSPVRPLPLRSPLPSSGEG